jgi:hydroxypyruvate isomerase
MTSRTFMRFAPHLGYLSPEEPLFRQSVGSIDPVDHVHFAAVQGFAGVFDPWIIARPAEQIESLIAALKDQNLESGGICYAPFTDMFTPLFARAGHTAWTEIEQHLERSIDLAVKVGAKTLAVVLQGMRDEPALAQQEAAAEHLRKAGDRAAKSGLVIGIEHMVALPDLMLQTTPAAVSFLDKVDHPAVQLIFDTGHVRDMDGDIRAAWALARDYVCVLQLADMPGRVEPGAGTIDFTRFLADAMRDGKASGLIELEHGWSEPSSATELSGIAALRAIDDAVRRSTETAGTGPTVGGSGQ